MGKKILFITIALFTLISAQDIKLKEEFTLDYEFVNPTDVDFDKEGNIYVFEWKTQEILVFDKLGKFLRKFGKKGRGPGDFLHSTLIELDKDDNIWICNNGNNRFEKIDKFGNYIKSYPFPSVNNCYQFNVSNFKITNNGFLHIALKDLFLGVFRYLQLSNECKLLKQKFHMDRLPVLEWRENHPEMSFANLLCVDEKENVFYAMTDDKLIHFNDSLKLEFPIEKIKLSEKEKEVLLHGFNKGYIAGAKSVKKNSQKINWEEKLFTETFIYKPFKNALISIQDKLLVFCSVKEKNAVNVKILKDQKLEGDIYLNLKFAHNIFSDGNESLVSDGNNLFYIQKDKDEFPQVIKYKVTISQ